MLGTSQSSYLGAGQRKDLRPLYLYEGDRFFLHASRGGIKPQDDGKIRFNAFLDYRFVGYPADRIPNSLAGMQARGQARKRELNRPLPRDVVFHEVPRPLLVQLSQPPQDDRYVRVASDILMIAVGTSLVVDAIADLGG